jgi:hypothetical protein
MERETDASKHFEARVCRILHLVADFAHSENKAYSNYILKRVKVQLQSITREEWHYIEIQKRLFIETKNSSRVFIRLVAVYLAIGVYFLEEERWGEASHELKIARRILDPVVHSITSNRSPTNQIGEAVLLLQQRVLFNLAIANEKLGKISDSETFRAECEAVIGWKPSPVKVLMQFVKDHIKL